MSTIISAISLAPSRPFAGFFGPLKTFFETIRTAHVAGRDFDRLNALTDRQLTDIGLCRAGLPRVILDRHFG